MDRLDKSRIIWKVKGLMGFIELIVPVEVDCVSHWLLNDQLSEEQLTLMSPV